MSSRSFVSTNTQSRPVTHPASATIARCSSPRVPRALPRNAASTSRLVVVMVLLLLLLLLLLPLVAALSPKARARITGCRTGYGMTISWPAFLL